MLFLILGFVCSLIFIFIVLLYYIYRYTFAADETRIADDFEVPQVDSYMQYEDTVKKNVSAMKEHPHEKVEITTKDKVKLVGHYYHMRDHAPLMLVFHGYRSSAYRDGMGAFMVSEKNGYNVLLVNQRAHKESGGRTITFGIKERYDCLEWIAYINKRFGENTPIILAGLSMGAATVLMAAGLELPKNVKAIFADCGYSTPKDIMSAVIKMMKVPVGPVYFMIRLSALVFGGFNLEAASAKESLRNCKIPVFLVHGEGDHLVPCYMSQENYDACASEKELFTVPGAEHGMSFLLDTEGYNTRLNAFLERSLKEG